MQNSGDDLSSSSLFRRRFSRRNGGVARKSFKRRVKRTDQLLAWIMERRDCFSIRSHLAIREGTSPSRLCFSPALWYIVSCNTRRFSHATLSEPLRHVNLFGNFLVVRDGVLSWEHSPTFRRVKLLIFVIHCDNYRENLTIRRFGTERWVEKVRKVGWRRQQ